MRGRALGTKSCVKRPLLRVCNGLIIKDGKKDTDEYNDDSEKRWKGCSF